MEYLAFMLYDPEMVW